MRLPPRTPADEDAFVAMWNATDDRGGLFEVIEALMEDHRPRLAARLVALLGDVDLPNTSAFERARTAAGLTPITTEPTDESAWTEFDEALAELRRRRSRRLRARYRRTVLLDPDDDRGPRRRR